MAKKMGGHRSQRIIRRFHGGMRMYVTSVWKIVSAQA